MSLRIRDSAEMFQLVQRSTGNSKLHFVFIGIYFAVTGKYKNFRIRFFLKYTTLIGKPGHVLGLLFIRLT